MSVSLVIYCVGVATRPRLCPIASQGDCLGSTNTLHRVWSQSPPPSPERWIEMLGARQQQSLVHTGAWACCQHNHSMVERLLVVRFNLTSMLSQHHFLLPVALSSHITDISLLGLGSLFIHTPSSWSLSSLSSPPVCSPRYLFASVRDCKFSLSRQLCQH